MKKSGLFIFFTALMLILLMTFSCIFAQAAVKYGDVNNDNNITVNDATVVQRHMAFIETLTGDALTAADVDGNNNVTISDATVIQRYVAQIIDIFPAQENEPVTTPTTKPTSQPTTKPTEIPTQAPTQAETIKKIDTNINIYFTNNRNWKTVYAYIYDEASGTPAVAWPGTQMTNSTTNNYGETVYSMKVDTSKYNRIIFTNGTAQTTDTPVTVANSGYFIQTTKNNKFVVGTYPYGQDNAGTITYYDLEYSPGYKKELTIWTPVGYNPKDTTKKYSVLYMPDGQNMFGDKSTLSGYEWEVDETILSYMQNGGDGIIVVGIDNSNNKRDSELTPDIGDVVPSYNSGGFKNGTGEAYADFVVEKVIPYIEANYNTNSIRGVVGSSSGGIEAFYIGMEHMDKFDYIGAISPAFLLYDKATWDKYLSKFDFSDPSKLPRIYFFNGNSPSDLLEQELYTNAVAMQGWMEAKGYPKSLMTTVVDKDGTHSELFWAVWFPEILSYGLGY